MQDKMNKIHNIDCLEFMKTVPNKYFDLVLTDPPYGLNIHNKNITRSGVTISKDYGIIDWDKKAPDKIYFDEIMRISKNQIIFGANHFIKAMPYNSPAWIVWNKDNGSTTFADCELAWTSFDHAVRIIKYKWNGMLQADMRNKEERFQPGQKPVRLFETILQEYAHIGNKIFDPFSGSGTTAIACKSLGLDWCACELNNNNFLSSIQRLNNVQGNLFNLSN